MKADGQKESDGDKVHSKVQMDLLMSLILIMMILVLAIALIRFMEKLVGTQTCHHILSLFG